MLKLVVFPLLMVLAQLNEPEPAENFVTVTLVTPGLLIAGVVNVPVPAVLTVRVAVDPVAVLDPDRLKVTV